MTNQLQLEMWENMCDTCRTNIIKVSEGLTWKDKLNPKGLIKKFSSALCPACYGKLLNKFGKRCKEDTNVKTKNL